MGKRINVRVVWMDGVTHTYNAASMRVWEGVLVLLDVAANPSAGASAKRRLNIPTGNIRTWDDDDE